MSRMATRDVSGVDCTLLGRRLYRCSGGCVSQQRKRTSWVPRGEGTAEPDGGWRCFLVWTKPRWGGSCTNAVVLVLLAARHDGLGVRGTPLPVRAQTPASRHTPGTPHPEQRPAHTNGRNQSVRGNVSSMAMSPYSVTDSVKRGAGSHCLTHVTKPLAPDRAGGHDAINVTNDVDVQCRACQTVVHSTSVLNKSDARPPRTQVFCTCRTTQGK